MNKEQTVDEGAAGERLDVYLAETLGQTRSQVQRQLRRSEVKVNGETGRPGYKVCVGDRIEVAAQPDASPAPAPKPPDLPVIYEDAGIMVVDKPAGLTVHAGSGTAGAATVADFARLHTADPDAERPGIVHRLDRDTSGLLVLAKNAAAKDFMQAQFREHRVRKTYQSLVVGRVKPPSAIIRLPLDRDPAKPLRRAVRSAGRPAITHYQTVAAYPGYTLLEATPETGRTHQIRVHFAALGHPVAGDVAYGPPKRPLGLTRQFLHAAALQFTAPSGATVNLHSPLPPELAGIIKRLEEQV